MVAGRPFKELSLACCLFLYSLLCVPLQFPSEYISQQQYYSKSPLRALLPQHLDCQDEGKMPRLCLVKRVGGRLQYLCLMCKGNGIKGKTAGYKCAHTAPHSKTQLCSLSLSQKTIYNKMSLASQFQTGFFDYRLLSSDQFSRILVIMPSQKRGLVKFRIYQSVLVNNVICFLLVK